VSVGALWGWDADGVGATGADGAAGRGLEGLAHADFDGGEVVVAATQGEALAWEGRVGCGEEIENLRGRHGRLVIEASELGGNGDAALGLTSEGEEGVG
jgi:hypothetical protein